MVYKICILQVFLTFMVCTIGCARVAPVGGTNDSDTRALPGDTDTGRTQQTDNLIVASDTDSQAAVPDSTGDSFGDSAGGADGDIILKTDTETDTHESERDCRYCSWTQVCNDVLNICECRLPFAGPDCTLCDTAAGYVTSPLNDDQCVQSRCYECLQRDSCAILSNIENDCGCKSGWSGPKCEYHWTVIVPPVTQTKEFRETVRLAIGRNDEKWVNISGRLFYFDDGNTPPEPSDDSWIFVPTPAVEGRNTIVTDMVPNPGGGIWIATRVLLESPYNFSSQLHYLSIGDIHQANDDQWMTYDTGALFASCLKLNAMDDTGALWLTNCVHKPGVFVDHLGVLHPSDTPFDARDDNLVTWSFTAGDLPARPYFAGTGIGNGVWFSDFYLQQRDASTIGPGDAIQGDFGSVSDVKLDSRQNAWLSTYNLHSGEFFVRYLNDGGTPLSTDDDVIVDYTTADGLAETTINHLAIDGYDVKWILNASPGQNEPWVLQLNDNDTPRLKDDDTWWAMSYLDDIVDEHGGRIYNMAVDNESNLWFAADFGIVYLQVYR